VRSWAELPVDRVIRLEGADADSIALAIDPLPEEAPAIVTYVAGPAYSTSELVASVLDSLERAAVALFPIWLPGAAEIDGATGTGVAAVRVLAMRHAATTDHFGPFLAALAVRALRAFGAGAGRFAPEVRAAGLARVLADSFGRSRVAILLRVPEGLSPGSQEVLVAGCEWLAHRGSLGVWLTGAPLPAIDRISTLSLQLPRDSIRLPDDAQEIGYPLGTGYPAIAGKPHPGSRSEQVLESALVACDWAAGRAWNQSYLPHPLAEPIRLDLLWARERCVVEVDGPDHRRSLKFAADRRRDVQLQLDGYAVLRFTDVHVMTDIETVVRQIERFLRNRRGGPSSGEI